MTGAERDKYLAEKKAAALAETKGRVLLADDEAMNRLVMKNVLRGIVPEWDVVEAATADAALAAVKIACVAGEPFDVVLFDEDFGFDPSTMHMRTTGTEATLIKGYDVQVKEKHVRPRRTSCS